MSFIRRNKRHDPAPVKLISGQTIIVEQYIVGRPTDFYFD